MWQLTVCDAHPTSEPPSGALASTSLPSMALREGAHLLLFLYNHIFNKQDFRPNSHPRQ